MVLCGGLACGWGLLVDAELPCVVVWLGRWMKNQGCFLRSLLLGCSYSPEKTLISCLERWAASISGSQWG